VIRRSGESWEDHNRRLQRVKTEGRHDGLRYNIVVDLLNAADYGVPQRRERVFFVGFRSDVGQKWSFPKKTHSRESLLRAQWLTGEYWEEHRVPKNRRPEPPAVQNSGVDRFSDLPLLPRWRTVRDAISDLPDPEMNKRNAAFNHVQNPGARAYPGHTGSPLDEPAKTLKAGDHGVPGGENMLALPDGSLRYFTVRESARLQTFPDQYLFASSWTESMRQIGNAVPVTLAQAVAESVRDVLAKSNGR
jgi:DNA (cytosine-5)-methyltransferase 1